MDRAYNTHGRLNMLEETFLSGKLKRKRIGYIAWKESTEAAYPNYLFNINPGDDGMLGDPGKMEKSRTLSALKEQVLRPKLCLYLRIRNPKRSPRSM
jgi:hypothetical protein